MIDEEIMNTAIAKHDARKLKDYANRIDGNQRREESDDSSKNADLTSSGTYKPPTKAVDQ